ncbi:hypothetical protein J4Q44_G00300080 [Coregonus suidteri]|uniref:Uncharacterized protein n=1 Tax=Coregonus suidteri TaxID=861788 RepID=A0AAN8QCI2_9TELE
MVVSLKQDPENGRSGRTYSNTESRKALSADEEVPMNVPREYGINLFSTTSTRTCTRVNKQHFSLNCLELGVVVARALPLRWTQVSAAVQDVDVLRPRDVQASLGLDTIRQTYIFKKIRTFAMKRPWTLQSCSKGQDRNILSG